MYFQVNGVPQIQQWIFFRSSTQNIGPEMPVSGYGYPVYAQTARF